MRVKWHKHTNTGENKRIHDIRVKYVRQSVVRVPH